MEVMEAQYSRCSIAIVCTDMLAAISRCHRLDGRHVVSASTFYAHKMPILQGRVLGQCFSIRRTRPPQKNMSRRAEISSSLNIDSSYAQS